MEEKTTEAKTQLSNLLTAEPKAIQEKNASKDSLTAIVCWTPSTTIPPKLKMTALLQLGWKMRIANMQQET